MERSKYADYSDEQLDLLIDLKVQRAINEWQTKIGMANLDANIIYARERAVKAKLDADTVSEPSTALRELMLEDIAMIPVVASDEEMEVLIHG